MQFQQLKILPHALTKTIFPKLLHHLVSQHLQNDREHGKNKKILFTSPRRQAPTPYSILFFETKCLNFASCCGKTL